MEPFLWRAGYTAFFFFHYEQQCQATLSSWFITAFRQQKRNVLFPHSYLAESSLLSKMLLKHCAKHSILNQIPVWVVLFLSYSQIGGFGSVSCCSETKKKARHHPKSYYLLCSGGLFSTMQFLYGKKWQRLPNCWSAVRVSVMICDGNGVFCSRSACAELNSSAHFFI